MATISFTYSRHPKLKTLVVDTGVNSIGWSYNLNTQAFPTYGGEVVQVLSTNIDVLTIQGDVRNYSEMENIYQWFIYYMQDATQGYKEQAGYSQEAIIMEYHERGWTLGIQPISLPALRYGLEVVVPTWQLEAHVLDPDPDMTELTVADIKDGKDTGLVVFKDLSLEIGYHPNNLFSDPLGIPNSAFEKNLLKENPNVDTKTALEGIGKKLNETLNSYLQQDMGAVLEKYDAISAPATAKSGKDSKTPDSTKKGK
jgi:hypothetical protein